MDFGLFCFTHTRTRTYNQIHFYIKDIVIVISIVSP